MNKKAFTALLAVVLIFGELISVSSEAYAAELDDRYDSGYSVGERRDNGGCVDGLPPSFRREHGGHHPRPRPIPQIPSDANEADVGVYSEERPYNWYCMRNSEHTLPRAESNMAFIRDYDAIYGDIKAAEAGDKVIYLTFDAGYENGNVSKILDVLKKHGAKGAFFILENLIKREPELIKRMSDEGHLLCNHTMKHPDMTRISSLEDFAEQVEGLEKYALETLGVNIAKYYRPPEGRFSRRDLGFAKSLGYKTVFWSFAYADWDNDRQPSAEQAEKKILENAHPGEIMLLHPTSSTNAAVLDGVLTSLENMGYRFGSLDEIA